MLICHSADKSAPDRFLGSTLFSEQAPSLRSFAGRPGVFYLSTKGIYVSTPARNHSPRARKPARTKSRVWEFRLYVAGQTPKSLAAIANLKKLCEEILAGQYKIDVIDLLENPQLARHDQVIAIPMLVRRSPEPVRKIIGDLSNTQDVLTDLELAVPRRNGSNR